MSQLRGDFNTELEKIRLEYPQVKNSTHAKLSRMKNDYTDNTNNGKEAAQSYRNELQDDYER